MARSPLNQATRQRGFTLIEIIVVLVLIALIMTLAATSISTSISAAETRALSRDMVAALRYTRGQAIVKREEQRLVINAGEKSYTIPVKDKTVTLPQEIDISLLTAESELTGEQSGAIRFFPDGSSTGGKVTLHLNQREWVITVGWLTGEVVLQTVDI